MEEHQRVLDENEALRRTLEEIEAKERERALLEEKKSAEKSAEALKKQAKGLADEYGRLLAQKDALENKLADFELVMGDEVKKAK